MHKFLDIFSLLPHRKKNIKKFLFIKQPKLISQSASCISKMLFFKHLRIKDIIKVQLNSINVSLIIHNFSVLKKIVS